MSAIARRRAASKVSAGGGFTAGTLEYTTGTSLTATEPDGAANGDLLVMFVFMGDETAITYPAGWSVEVEYGNATGADRRAAVLTITRGASAPALGLSALSSYDIAAQVFGFSSGASLVAAEAIDQQNKTAPAPHDGTVSASNGDVALFGIISRVSTVYSDGPGDEVSSAAVAAATSVATRSEVVSGGAVSSDTWAPDSAASSTDHAVAVCTVTP